MTHTTAKQILNYTFDASRKYNHYCFEGNWMNAGDFAEVSLKAVLGYEPIKDANTPYDVGSDIEDLRASVKSAKSSLVNRYLGDDFDTVATNYFATTHSTIWVWVVLIDDMVEAYWMNEKEFREFVAVWGSWDKSRKTIRFKISSSKMIQWLESKKS